ncbi:MAG TPA: 16S rRNA (guanine(527)-N(7))-methyltransferase RsmG [Candidatus Deferrimicrobium sp.]|nr:16S rRNA (guanine(527)-N(7))-methyltransferase RsmG [Candidatus Deferrimicrobium sp.]
MIEDLLITGGANLNINFTDDQIKKFVVYMNLLREWNQKVNLTAITDPEEIVIKHFLDSLLLLPYIPKKGTLADIGTGAGFPGIPLKIVVPELEVTLIDSLSKRIKFLDEVIGSLGLNGIKTFHGRAEDVGRLKIFREGYDIVVARAVSRLTTLTEYCLPMVKIGGKFIAAKGPSVSDEVEEAKFAVDLLGGRITATHQSSLPLKGDARSIVVIEKIRPTSNLYPRKAGTPDKKPLIKPN